MRQRSSKAKEQNGMLRMNGSEPEIEKKSTLQVNQGKMTNFFFNGKLFMFVLCKYNVERIKPNFGWWCDDAAVIVIQNIPMK